MGNVYVGTDGATDCFWSQDAEPELKCNTLPMIAKFYADGALSWVSRLTAKANIYAELRGLAVDPFGRAYMSGRLVPPSDDQAHGGFAVKLDPFGNQVWGGEYYYPSLRELFFIYLETAGWNRLIVSAELIDRAAGEIDNLLLKFAAPRSSRIIIVKYPASQTVAAGQTATFSVAATRVRESSYQWRFNGHLLSGQTSRTLAIPDVQPSHAGDYSVIISDGRGSIITPEARLTVTP